MNTTKNDLIETQEARLIERLGFRWKGNVPKPDASYFGWWCKKWHENQEENYLNYVSKYVVWA